MPVPAAEQQRGSGLFGQHVSLTYATDDECRELLAGFVERAVSAGHRVAIFLDESSYDLARALTAAASAAAPGQFTVLRYDTGQSGSDSEGTFGGKLPGGPFGVEEMLAGLGALAEATFAEGRRALSVAGEMVWTRRAGFTPADLIDYETRVNRFFGDPRITGLCLYDGRRFDRDLLARIGAVHPGPLLRFTLGGWGAHLRLTGELDASNAGALPPILDLVAGADVTVLLDASDLSFLDAAGAGTIVRFAESRPGHHTVIRCARGVRQALELVGAGGVPGLVLRDRVAGV